MSQGLWRAASTLTYENALAAFLTVPALFCLDRLMTAAAPQRAVSEAAYVVVVGIGASLSRGGVLGLLIGIGVLGAWRGPRSLVRLGPPVTGAVVSLACLAPSLPVHSSTHVGLACAGFVAGGGAAAWTPGFRRWHGSRRWRIGAGAAAAAVVGALVAVVSTAHVAGAIARARLSASGDRAHEWSAAWAVARAHLVLGVGAARVPLQWEQSGHVATATFAHNEFLQLLVQDGVVGLAVLLVGLTWVVVRLARVRGRAAAWSAECAVSCLVALLVQGALDFVWHIPVIPVLMAVMLALATTTEPGSRLGAAAAPVRAVVAPGPRR
jgi:hypothetical protein